jgi:hypothetical protein
MLKGANFNPRLGGPTVAFPGVFLLKKFDEDCERAETVCKLAKEKATKERDWIVGSISRGRMEPSKRLLAAVETRCAGKVKDAEEACEAACGSAQKELFDALDQLEAGA